jgi:hypothetical protein
LQIQIGLEDGDEGGGDPREEANGEWMVWATVLGRQEEVEPGLGAMSYQGQMCPGFQRHPGESSCVMG